MSRRTCWYRSPGGRRAFKGTRDAIQEPADSVAIEIAEAIAEAVRRIAALDLRPNTTKLTHVAMQPRDIDFGMGRRLRGAIQKLAREVDSGDAVTSARKFDGMAAISASNIQHAGSGSKLQSRLQKRRLLLRDGGRNDTGPELDRWALKKSCKPLGIHLDRVTGGPRTRTPRLL